MKYRPNLWIFGISLLFGLLFWVADAALDAFIFDQGAFWNHLVRNIPPQDLSERLLVLAFLLLGVGSSLLLSGRRRTTKAELEGGIGEESLRESEERFREMAELLPEVVFETDLNLNLTYSNQRAFELFGYTKEDLRRGLHALAMLSPPDQERARKAFQARLEGGDPGVVEYSACRKDGTTFPVHFHASIIRREGRFAGLRGVIVDLTERVRAEEEIRSIGRGFQSIVESSPMGMFFYEAQAGDRLVLSGSNPAADLILGVDSSAFVGMTIEEAFPALAATEIPQRYKDSALHGIPWQTDQVDYNEGGIQGAFEVVAFQTAPGKMAVIFHDITARAQAREAVEASEEKLRSVIEQSNDAIYILHKDRFDLVNQKFCELIGATPEEIRDPSFVFWDLVAEKSRPLLEERQAKRAQGEQVPGLYEFLIRRRDGRLVQVEASVSEIDYSGGRAVLGILRNITEHRSLQNQLHQALKMESIGRLSGGVAHDLNNLLTPIIGYAELISDASPPEDEGKEFAEEIIRAGFRSQDLVRQLLAFSRQQTLEFTVLDLNALVSGFNNLLRRTIREDIQIRVDIGTTAPVIRGDKGQLEQVLMNLAVNAQDAMPNGGTLHIETTETVLDDASAKEGTEAISGRYALLTITDSGVGMDSDTRDRIFEPFFTTKERGHGTGLGLATVFGIVKQHGGHIWVHSEPGEGTTFECYFPIVDGQPQVEAVTAGPEPTTSGTETVMVVEDEEVVRNLAVSILRRKGYQVISAEDGPECLRLLEARQSPIDLLLTDVVLPGMNGRDLYEQVAKRFPTRVLYMSGYTHDVVSHRGVLDEGVSFIQKPFSVLGLAQKVREVLDRE